MTDHTQYDISALEELGNQFRGLADSGKTAPAIGGRARLAVAALAVVLALGVFSLTPPGRAAAEWVADQFRAGEPGGPPTLTEFREFATEGTIADGVRANVLASGPATQGLRFEFITFRSNADGMHCFEVNILKESGGPFSSGGGGCGQVPETAGLRMDSWGANVTPDRELFSVLGRVSEDVKSVEVEFDGQVVEADLVEVDEALIDRFNFAHPFSVFSAFFSEVGEGGRAQVTARDEAGNEIASQRYYVMNPFLATPEGVCGMARRDARRKGTAAAAARARHLCKSF